MSNIIFEDDFKAQVKKKRHMVKVRAAKRGIKCTLTTAAVAKLLSKKRCFYTGIKFDNAREEFNLTFDRKDNSKGYTGTNTVACLACINGLKNNLFESLHAPFRVNGKGILSDNPAAIVKVLRTFSNLIEARYNDV